MKILHRWNWVTFFRLGNDVLWSLGSWVAVTATCSACSGDTDDARAVRTALLRKKRVSPMGNPAKMGGFYSAPATRTSAFAQTWRCAQSGLRILLAIQNISLRAMECPNKAELISVKISSDARFPDSGQHNCTLLHDGESLEPTSRQFSSHLRRGILIYP